MEASDDDRDIAIELANLYFELTDEELVGLKEAANTGQRETVSAIAHKCSGSSAACGISGLANLLKSLELDTKQGLPDDLQERLGKIDAEMNAARAALGTHFNCAF